MTLSNGNIDPNSLDFIVKAHDEQTLQAITKVFPNNHNIKEYVKNNSVEQIINNVKSLHEDCKKALNNENQDYISRLIRWKIENEW